jgi:hypothetical protein
MRCCFDVRCRPLTDGNQQLTNDRRSCKRRASSPIVYQSNELRRVFLSKLFSTERKGRGGGLWHWFDRSTWALQTSDTSAIHSNASGNELRNRRNGRKKMQPSASNAVWRSIGCGWHVGGCVLLGCENNTQTLLLLLLLAVAHISTRRLNFPHLFPGVGVSCDVYRQQQQHDKNKDKNEPRRRRNSFLDLSLLYSF